MSAFLVSKKPLGGNRRHGTARASAAQMRPHTSHGTKLVTTNGTIYLHPHFHATWPGELCSSTGLDTRPAPITDGGRMIREKSVIEEAGSLLEASKQRFFTHRRTWRVPMSSSPGSERTERKSGNYAPVRISNNFVVAAYVLPAHVARIPCSTKRVAGRVFISSCTNESPLQGACIKAVRKHAVVDGRVEAGI